MPIKPILSGRARNPLPEGTVPVGVGVAISGICLYGFITVASRALGATLYAPFAAFWPLLFVFGPGFFLPLEQEVGRALAARRGHGEGGGPLVRRAGLAGLAMAVVLMLVILAVFPALGLTSRLFDGYSLLLFALVAGFAAYFGQYLTRGTLSGNGRFRAYGILMGSEGVFRVIGCVALALGHVHNPGYYAVVMVAGSVLAIGAGLRGERNLVNPGPDAPWTELTTALGYLLLTSVLTQFLLNVGPIAVKFFATGADAAKTGPFLNGLIIARVPLFLFQAVQAALLPKLAGYASSGRHGDLRRALRRLLGLVGVIAVVATVGAFVLGPWLVVLLFGKGFYLGSLDLGYLAFASAGYMVALVLTQALISLHGYTRALSGWCAGVVGFFAVTLLGSDLYGRVERGLVGSAIVAIAVMGSLLWPLLQTRTDLDSDAVTDEFAEAAVHVVAEP